MYAAMLPKALNYIDNLVEFLFLDRISFIINTGDIDIINYTTLKRVVHIK